MDLGKHLKVVKFFIYNNYMDKIFILVIIILVLFLFRKNTITVKARVAKTSDEIRKGLMFIKKPLPKNEGMIFLMPFKNNHLFWMKNTFIPLDIIFIDKTKNKNKFKIIGFHKNRKPLDEVLMGIGTPSDYVLEMNGGWLDKNKLKKRNIIKIKYLK